MIHCPSCQTANAPGARFCNQCGASLPESTAAGAGERSSTTERAEPSDAAGLGRPVAGERRVVTILFSDIAGSTALAHGLDPEAWADIMAGAFERFTEPVSRYGGTVARIMGDAVLAFFGAPVAHEDDPRRAVLAGLGILDAMAPYADRVERRYGRTLAVRVGINTGLAVVGEVGSDHKAEYSAMGDAVNLAARMEQTAAPGTVQISEATFRRVASAFDVEPLGSIDVKGRPEPVAAYRVLRERPRPASDRGVPGLEAPLVGRARELAMLADAFEDLRRGRGRIVSLMGDAGLGKSRLLAEVRAQHGPHGNGADGAAARRSATTDGTGVGWHEGRSYSYRTTTPYAPVADLLRDVLGLEPSGEASLEHVRAAIADVPGAAALGADDAPFLARLLGARDASVAAHLQYLEPHEVRHRTFESVRSLLEAVARTRPTVLVLEDLHWADETSLDLLETLLPLTDEAMLMVLAVFRPQRTEPSWRFHELASRDYGHRYLPITLAPLDDGESRELVGRLLHVDGLAGAVRDKILAKAEGNPFYVEEVIRSLLDAGAIEHHEGRWRATAEIDTIQVPETLAGVLTARVDRLDPGVKRVLQTASVIGREFPLAALEEVHDEQRALPSDVVALERRELIRLRARLPDEVYQFKHVLIQETTYASLLLRRRRELHRRTAECILRLAPDRVQDIARHYLAAEDVESALPYMIEAGEEALSAYALADARRWLEQARDALDAHGDAAAARRTLEGLGKTLELSGEAVAALDVYTQMQGVADAAGDTSAVVSALNKRAFVTGVHFGRIDEAFALLDEAEEVARARSEMPGLIETSMIRCGACAVTGKFGEAIDYLGESTDIAATLGMDAQRAFALTHLSSTLVSKLDFAEAERRIDEAVALCERIGDTYHLAELRAFPLPQLLLARGDAGAAVAEAREARAASKRIGVGFAEAAALTMLGSLERAAGDTGAAMRDYRDGIEVARQGGPRGGLLLPWLITGLWRTALELGSDAYAAAREEFEALFEPFEETAGTPSWCDLADVAVARGEWEAAEAYVRRALATPGPRWLLDRPRAWLGSASLALRRGGEDGEAEAARSIGDARTFVEEHGLRHFEPEVALAEAELARARGQIEHALERYAIADGAAASLGFRPLRLRALEGRAVALRRIGRRGEADAAAGQADELRAELSVVAGG